MNAPWLEHYDPGVPRSIGSYPEKTLALNRDVTLAEDGHSTWPDVERSAEEIVASQNLDLGGRGVVLRRTAELVAAIANL